jgi:nitroreductase
MPPILSLDPDELLSTTRSVRKRLDLSRPVEPELIRECIELAAQAPTGGNNQGWHFVVVTDEAKRRQLAEWYAVGFNMIYGNPDAVLANLPEGDPAHVDTTRRVISSAQYLADHLAEVPVHVIPVIEGRTDNGAPVAMQAAIWGSLFPAVWSFMLAARSRGLGTTLTTLHLIHEQQAAELLGLPDHVMQGALIPVAHTLGTDFKPGARRDLDRIIHNDGW